LNDLRATLELAERRLKAFSRDTSPEEFDFFHAVLVYLHVLHGLQFEEGSFGNLEEKIMHDWQEVLLFRPGLERGERRGYADMFDRIFEDGFGVIYPYGILYPSRRRRHYFYTDYRREVTR